MYWNGAHVAEIGPLGMVYNALTPTVRRIRTPTAFQFPECAPYGMVYRG